MLVAVVAAAVFVGVNGRGANTTDVEFGGGQAAAAPAPASPAAAGTDPASPDAQDRPTGAPREEPQPAAEGEEAEGGSRACFAGIQLEPDGRKHATPEAAIAAFQANSRGEAERIANSAGTAIDRARAAALSAGADRLVLMTNNGNVAEFEYQEDGDVLAQATALRGADGWYVADAHAAAGPEVCAVPSPPPSATRSPSG